MLTWIIDYSGTPDARDIAAATYAIERENERRLADVDENGEPKLPPLPYANGAQLKASYIALKVAQLAAVHERTTTQAAEKALADGNALARWKAATPAQQAAALAELPEL